MVAEADEPEHVLGQWRAGRASGLDLYTVVRDAMNQAARRAIWQMTGDRPDPHAVQEAVSTAFGELWAQDPAEVKNVVGLAARMAFRRGQDQARQYISDRKAARALTERLGDSLLFADLDEDAAEQRAERIADVRDCIGGLTDAQRAVIEQTYMNGVPLSDWANEHGTSYEAARRQRQRGLDSVRRCMEHKKQASDEGDQDGGSR